MAVVVAGMSAVDNIKAKINNKLRQGELFLTGIFKKKSKGSKAPDQSKNY